MRVLVVLALFVAAASAKHFFPHFQPLSEDLITYVNKYAQTTWTVRRLTDLCKPNEGHNLAGS